METITYTVPPEEDGIPVRHVLRAKLHFSARAVSRLKTSDTGILVNGERACTNRVLHPGDVVRAETGDQRGAMRDRMAGGIVPGDWPLEIVWEDAHLLVVNKPAGMTAHAANFSPDAPTVAGALAFRRGTDFVFHPVNRLDRGTTGLMAVAKSGYLHDRLRRLLHTDAFRRTYRAIVTGVPVPEGGTIAAPIGRDERSLLARQVRPDGKEAVTHYRTLASGAFPNPDTVLASDTVLSLVELYPETGRTHQLRVHMAYMGCPLAGDWLYGREDPALIDRPALHSYRMELTHPVTGERLKLEAPLPPDMARLVRGIQGGETKPQT